MTAAELTLIDDQVLVACTVDEAMQLLDGPDPIAAWFRVNRPVFCIRSGWVLGLDVRSGFERSSRVRIRLVGCRRARCAGAVG